jgi:hypothetical protein
MPSQPRTRKVTKSFWTYIYTLDQVLQEARNRGIARVGQSNSWIIWNAWNLVYNRLKRYGPVRIYTMRINNGFGVMLTIGYPNQELGSIPPRLLKRAIRQLGSSPRLVSSTSGWGKYTTPVLNGEGVDELLVRDKPEV